MPGHVSRSLIGALCGAFLLAVSQHSSASSVFNCDDKALESPMRAYLSGGTDRRVLTLAGSFESEGSAGSKNGSYIDVRTALRRKNYHEVHLCSGGGSVAEGYKLGREFVRLRSKVRVPSGYLCASSCTIAMLGGYLRTIDRDADFVVHASSAVSSIHSSEQSFFFECGDSSRSVDAVAQSDCAEMIAIIRRVEFSECDSFEDYKLGEECNHMTIGADSRPEQLLINGTVPVLLAPSNRFVNAFTRAWARRQVGAAVELVQYYQEMLNDGRRSVINGNAYRRAVLSEDWGQREAMRAAMNSSESSDFVKLTEAETPIDRLVVWQKILTEIEIAQKYAVVEVLRSSPESLGRGASNALDIMEAMSTCRIQSSCYLDRNAAVRLGYHNFDLD